jgi:hypothetical protein
MVQGAGLTWEALVVIPWLASRSEPLLPDPPPTGWRELARQCAAHFQWLSDWERAFLAGLPRRTRLSAKQVATLNRIALKLRNQGLAV